MASRNAAAYRAQPPTEEEVAMALVEPDQTDLADDTDWEALYPVSE